MKSYLWFITCITALSAVVVQGDTLVANELKHIETKENSFSITLPRDSESYAYIIMQPCFGRDLKLCLYYFMHT